MQKWFNTAGPCKADIHYMLSSTERLPEIKQLIRVWQPRLQKVNLWKHYYIYILSLSWYSFTRIVAIPDYGQSLVHGNVISMSLMVGLCILVLSLMKIQIISKTYMTRVEGENSRLRHYLARLHRKTFCYSKSLDMLRYSVRLLIHYLHDPSILSSL